MPMNQESSATFPFPDFASSVSATDRTTLEGLGKDEIREWALRKSEEYRLLSYTMLSLHNAAAPIHTLPVELLMKVFGMTWTKWSLQGLRPTLVCRRWRTVYLATPEFWADAVAGLRPTLRSQLGIESFLNCIDEDVRPPPEFLAMLLDRSWPCPIPMRVKQEFRRSIVLPPQPLLLSRVFTHPMHVVDLSVQTTVSRRQNLYRVLNAGIPALEKLDVRTVGRYEPPDLGDIFAGLPPVSASSLPRLHTLHLVPAIFFPLIAPLQSLKSVYLESYGNVEEQEPWPHPPGAESLLRLFSRCANLECLTLYDFQLSRWWPPLGRGEPGAAVLLPSLKSLYIRNEDRSWGRYILAALSVLDPCIPSTASVYFSPLRHERDHPNPSLSTLIPAHVVQHHPFNTVMLCAEGGSCFQSATWTIRCLKDQAMRWETAIVAYRTLGDLGIEDFFQAYRVTHLEIVFDSNWSRNYYHHQIEVTGTDPAEDWAPILRAFPHLTHLTVSGEHSTNAAVDALGAVLGHGVAAADWGSDLQLASESPVWPALRYVTLGWEVPREIGPEDLVRACDAATYRQHQDVGPRVEQRCSVLQLAFERRASMKAERLHALEFYEYERQRFGEDPDGRVPEFGELIAASRRDDSNLPCLKRLRAVVGGPVVYRGYLLKTVDDVSSDRC